MTRIVWVTMLYALLAALVLAAPLAASEEVQPGQVQPEQAPAAQAVVEEAVAPPAAPEVAAPEVAPAPAVPEGEPAPPQPEPSQVVDTAPVERPRKKAQVKIAMAAASGSVTISDFRFAPASVTVEVGDTVTWTNDGPTAHSATGDRFDTGIFSKGQSRSETFNEAGTFSYICTPHPQMKGTVTVQAAAAQGGDDTSSTGSEGGAAADTGSTAADDSGTGAASSSVPTLPSTGLDAGGLLLLGLMTLGLGAFLRRRTAGTG
jgi:plastocyanin